MDIPTVFVQHQQTYRVSYLGEQHPGFGFRNGVAYVTSLIKMTALLSLTTCLLAPMWNPTQAPGPTFQLI